MGQMKNFDPALYESDFDAVVGFIEEGHLNSYDFNVSAGFAFKNALAYLCLNNIPHQYTATPFGEVSLVSLVFGNDVEYSYTFFTTYKENQDEV